MATQDALWRLMRERGWGTIRHVERSLGWPKNQLHKARARGLRLDEIFAVLQILNEPPGRFFATVFGDGPTTAGDRFRSEGGGLLSRLDIDVPELASPTRPNVLTDIELDALDRARFEDPRVAIDQSRGLAFLAASEGRQGDAAACAGRWGSALRVAEQWYQAHAVVCWAINHASEGPTLADLWRRAAAIVADYGRFGDAAELAKLSMTRYAELGDFTGVAWALVSRGINLRRAERYRDAIQCLLSSADCLPLVERTGHLGIHQNLGLAYVALGNSDAAAHHTEIASTYVAEAVSAPRYLRWLRARIATTRGDLVRAISLYERVVVELEGSADAALVGAELARCYLAAGRPSDAVVTAQGLAALAMPQRTNRVVASAIADLWRTAAAGGLTLDAVDRAIVRIRRGRQRRAIASSHSSA